jgi:hypothetical protein
MSKALRNSHRFKNGEFGLNQTMTPLKGGSTSSPKPMKSKNAWVTDDRRHRHCRHGKVRAMLQGQGGWGYCMQGIAGRDNTPLPSTW